MSHGKEGESAQNGESANNPGTSRKTARIVDWAKALAPEDMPEEKKVWSGERMRIREIVTSSLGSLETFKATISTEGKIGGLGKVLDCFELFFPLVKGNKKLLEQLTEAFCQSQMEQNVIYTEARYAPHFLAAAADEVPATTLPDAESVVKTISDVLTRWSQQHPSFPVNQILCCVDSMPSLSAEVAALAVQYRGMDGGVVGVDVACGEFSFTTEEEAHRNAFAAHKAALAAAKAAALGVTVHAGECGRGSNVLRALDEYGADRIGHGYSIYTDEAALARCRDPARRPHIEVCPTSSIACESVPDPEALPRSADVTWDARLGVGGDGWEKHVLGKMVLDEGLSVSVSSDDPAVFGCSLSSDLSLVAEKLHLASDAIRRLTENAAKAAFVSEEKKQALLRTIADYYRTLDTPPPPKKAKAGGSEAAKD